MIFRKLCAALFLAVLGTACLYAQNSRVVIIITGIQVDGGTVYVNVFSNEKDYKKDIAATSFVLESNSAVTDYELELPEGEYLVSMYQDTNNNGKLDGGLFGIPKEPVGISNYNGQGIPGSFQKLQVPVNGDTAQITVTMGKIKL